MARGRAKARGGPRGGVRALPLPKKLGPTPEREARAQAGSVDRVEVEDEKGRRVIAQAPKKFLSPIEALTRSRALGDGEVEAGALYYRDWFIGTHPSRVVPRYGEYLGHAHEGEANQDAAARRAYHHQRWIKAVEFLGESLTPLAGWLILEQPFEGENAPPSLEQVGRSISHYKRRDQATAAAVGMLKAVLARLRELYGV